MLNYLLFAGLYLSLFYLAFQVASYRNYDFQQQRILALLSLAMSLLLPLLEIGQGFQEAVYAVTLPVVEIRAIGQAIGPVQDPAGAMFGAYDVMNLLFLLGSGLFLLRFIYGINKLRGIIRAGEKITHEGLQVIKSGKITMPCSFGQYILVPAAMDITAPSARLILAHEQKHVTLKHSLDNVLFAGGQILFWWLPFYYLFQQRLRLVHEYQVDHYMITTKNKYEYSSFLIEQVPVRQELMLVNNFYSFLKKRIRMMYQQKKQFPKVLSYGIYVLLLPALFFMQSCQSAEEPVIVEAPKAEKKATNKGGNTYEEAITDTIIVFDPATKEETMSVVNSTRTVYKTPDQMPLEASCANADSSMEAQKECSQKKLLEFIYSNIKYPEEARSKEIEGTVVCKFVITETGMVSSPEIVREVGYGTSEEVLRMIRKMNRSGFKWKPGQVNGEPVNVMYHVPVKFRLE